MKEMNHGEPCRAPGQPASCSSRRGVPDHLRRVANQLAHSFEDRFEGLTSFAALFWFLVKEALCPV
jgi:hypothetical protein